MPKIHWPQLNRTLDVAVGTTVLDAALDHGIPLEHACGGFCACTTCHVEVLSGIENLSPMEEMEIERIAPVDGRTDHSRLGCQAQIRGDITLRIPTFEQGA